MVSTCALAALLEEVPCLENFPRMLDCVDLNVPRGKPLLQRNNLRQFFGRDTVATNLKFPKGQIYPEADYLESSS
jgi:hypothetical protein